MAEVPTRQIDQLASSQKIGWAEGEVFERVGKGDVKINARLTLSDGVKGIFHVPAMSAEPPDPDPGCCYFDDGTNTADGKGHFRRFNGSSWDDV